MASLEPPNSRLHSAGNRSREVNATRKHEDETGDQDGKSPPRHSAGWFPRRGFSSTHLWMVAGVFILANIGVQIMAASSEQGCTGRHCRVEIDGQNYRSLKGSQDPIARRRILENTNILDCGLCSGHGTCNNQDDERCECEDGWDAAMNCSTPKNCESSADCSSHGICVKGGHPGRQSDANATRCECDPGWSGLSCNIAACPHNCSGHGTCDRTTGKCECDPMWNARPSCSVRGCSSNCTHGACVDGVCECSPGFSGSTCSDYICLNRCSGHGTCRPELKRCDCSPWFTGEDCSFAVCPFGCTGHGSCIDGACVCDPGFDGYDCSFENCPNQCSGHGTCQSDGICLCQTGFRGADCTDQLCAIQDCSGHGACQNATCICDRGYSGLGCEFTSGVFANFSCPGNCSSHGVCVDAACDCDYKWKGLDCSIEELCPNGCSGHGSCNNGTCACDPGWLEDNCGSLNPSTWCQRNCTSGSGIFLNGTCFCSQNGANTDCANNCSGHGTCSPSPFVPLSLEDSKTACTSENRAFDDVFVSFLKNRGLTQIMCPFGIPVVGHQSFSSKILVVGANVLASLLDKNGDGVADNPAVLKGLKDHRVVAIGGVSKETEDLEEFSGGWKTFGLQAWKVQDGSEEDIKRTVVEEIFHMMTQWGWGSAFHKDVGSRDWSSVACTEMQRVACSKPGWMHPENKCPGAILREGDYVFPDDHTYRRPGSPGFKHPLPGTCNDPNCDCVEFFHQAALVYVGATPGWFGREMPTTQRAMKKMLSTEFKAMLDKGEIITDEAQVSGSYGNATCFCDAGYTGVDCSVLGGLQGVEVCPGHCSGHGTCVNRTCTCDMGWTAADCSVSPPYFAHLGCPNDCTGHGSCSANATCICDAEFFGQDCSLSVAASQPCAMNCSGHGACYNSTCWCNSGFMGVFCEMMTLGSTPLPGLGIGSTPIPWLGSTPVYSRPCQAGGCSGHGTCDVSSGICTCDPGYSGSECESYLIARCQNDCSQNGVCLHVVKGLAEGVGIGHGVGSGDGHLGSSCLCDFGWGGQDCSIRSYCGGHSIHMSANCSGHGMCLNGTCSCQSGWVGEDCSSVKCPSDCSNRGICSNGTCACDFGWRGTGCTLISCPNDCSGHGICSSDHAVPQCVCDNLWSGSDCSIPVCPTAQKLSDPYVPCSGHGACTQNGTCICQKNYDGDDCNILIDCSGRGVRTCGFCVCEDGFKGDLCEIDVCADSRVYDPLKPGNHRFATVCSGHGKCTTEKGCVCESGAGRNCSLTAVCPKNCNGNGKCVGKNGIANDPGQCICNSFTIENSPFPAPMFSGDQCQTPVCPGQRIIDGQVIECSGKGICLEDKSCDCFSVQGEGLYTGLDCGNPPFYFVSDLQPKVGPLEGGTNVTVFGPGIERYLLQLKNKGEKMYCDFKTGQRMLAHVGPVVDSISCFSPPTGVQRIVQVALVGDDGVAWIPPERMNAPFQYFVQTSVLRVWPSYAPLRPTAGNGQIEPDLRKPNTITVTGDYFPPNGNYVCRFGDCVSPAQRVDQANVKCDMPRLAQAQKYPISVSSNDQQFSVISADKSTELTVYGIESISPLCGAQEGTAMLTVMGKHLVDVEDMNRNPVRFYCRFGVVTENGATKPDGTSRGDIAFVRFAYHSKAVVSKSLEGALECNVPDDTVIDDYFAISLDAEAVSKVIGDPFYVGQYDSNPAVRFRTYFPAAVIAELERVGSEISRYRMEPTLGPIVGGTRVTVNGKYFDYFKYHPDHPEGKRCLEDPGPRPGCRKEKCNASPIPRCSFGMAITTQVEILDDKMLVCTAPAFTRKISQPTVVSLEISLDGQTYTSSMLSYQYNPIATVTSVAPTAGVKSGGTPISIFGSNFVDSFLPRVLKCVFISQSDSTIRNESDAIFVSSSTVECNTPEMMFPGMYKVDVSLSGQTDTGQLTQSQTDFLFYQDPIVETLSEPIGTIHGGEIVNVNGLFFRDLGEIKCRFGDIIVKGDFESERLISCTAPRVVNPVSVQMSISLNGVDYTTQNAIYVFYEIVKVHPSSGPRKGGTWVTVAINGGPAFIPSNAFQYRVKFGRPKLENGIDKNLAVSGSFKSISGGVAQVSFFIPRYDVECDAETDTKGCTKTPLEIHEDEYPARVSLAFTNSEQYANFPGQDFMFYEAKFHSVLPCEAQGGSSACQTLSIPKDGNEYTVTFQGEGLRDVKGIQCAFWPIKNAQDLNSWDCMFTAKKPGCQQTSDFRTTILNSSDSIPSNVVQRDGFYEKDENAIGCFAPAINATEVEDYTSAAGEMTFGYVATVALNGQNFDHEVFQILYLTPPRVSQILSADGNPLGSIVVSMDMVPIKLKIIGSHWTIADSISFYNDPEIKSEVRLAGVFPNTLSCIFYAPMSPDGIQRFVPAQAPYCTNNTCEAICPSPKFTDEEMGQGVLFTQVFMSMNRRDPCMKCGCSKLQPSASSDTQTGSYADASSSGRALFGDKECVCTDELTCENMKQNLGWNFDSPVSRYNKKDDSFCNTKQLSHVLFCGNTNGCYPPSRDSTSMLRLHNCSSPQLHFSEMRFLSPPTVNSIYPETIGRRNNQTIIVALQGRNFMSVLWKDYPDGKWNPSIARGFCAGSPPPEIVPAVAQVTYIAKNKELTVNEELTVNVSDVKFDLCRQEIFINVTIPCADDKLLDESQRRGMANCFEGPFRGTHFNQSVDPLLVRFAFSVNGGLQFATSETALKVYVSDTKCPDMGCGHGTCVTIPGQPEREQCLCGVFRNDPKECTRDGTSKDGTSKPESYGDMLTNPDSVDYDVMVGSSGSTDPAALYIFCPHEESPACQWKKDAEKGSFWQITNTRAVIVQHEWPLGNQGQVQVSPLLKSSVLRRGMETSCLAGPSVDQIWPTLGSAAGGTTVTLDMSMWWYPGPADYGLGAANYPWEYYEMLTDTWKYKTDQPDEGPRTPGEQSSLACYFGNCHTSTPATMLNPESVRSGNTTAKFRCQVPTALAGLTNLTVSIRNTKGEKSPRDFTGKFDFLIYEPPVLLNVSVNMSMSDAPILSAPICQQCMRKQDAPEGRSFSSCNFRRNKAFGADCPGWGLQVRGAGFLDTHHATRNGHMRCRYAWAHGNFSVSTRATWISPEEIECPLPSQGRVEWLDIPDEDIYLDVTVDEQVYTKQKFRVRFYAQPTIADDRFSGRNKELAVLGGFGVNYKKLKSDYVLENHFGVDPSKGRVLRDGLGESDPLEVVEELWRRAPTKGGTPLALTVADGYDVLKDWEETIQLMFSPCPAPPGSTSHQYLDGCTCDKSDAHIVRPSSSATLVDEHKGRKFYELSFLTPSLPTTAAGDYLVCLAVNGFHFAPLEQEEQGTASYAGGSSPVEVTKLYRVGFTFYPNPTLASLGFNAGPSNVRAKYNLAVFGENFPVNVPTNEPRYPFMVQVYLGGLPPEQVKVSIVFRRVEKTDVTVVSTNQINFIVPNMTQRFEANFRVNISISFNGYDFTQLERQTSEFQLYRIPIVGRVIDASGASMSAGIFPAFGHKDFNTVITIFGSNFENTGRTKCRFEELYNTSQVPTGRKSPLVPATYINSEQMKCTIEPRLKGPNDQYPKSVDRVKVYFTPDGSEHMRDANPTLFDNLLIPAGEFNMFDDVPALNMSVTALPLEGGDEFPIAIKEKDVASGQNDDVARSKCLDLKKMSEIHPVLKRRSLQIAIIPDSSIWSVLRPAQYGEEIPTTFVRNVNGEPQPRIRRMIYKAAEEGTKQALWPKWSCLTILVLTSPELPYPMVGNLKFSYNDGQKFVGPPASILFYRGSEKPAEISPLRGSASALPRPQVTIFFARATLSGGRPDITALQAQKAFKLGTGCNAEAYHTCPIEPVASDDAITGMCEKIDGKFVESGGCCNPLKVMICPRGPQCQFQNRNISAKPYRSQAEFVWDERLKIFCEPPVMDKGLTYVNVSLNGLAYVRSPTLFYFFAAPIVERVYPTNCLFDTRTRLRVTGREFLENDKDEVQMYCIFDFKNVTPAEDQWPMPRFYSVARYIDSTKVECNAPSFVGRDRPSVPRYPRAQVGIIVDGRCSPSKDDCRTLINVENALWSDGFLQYTDRPIIDSVMPSSGFARNGGEGLLVTIFGSFFVVRSNVGRKSSWSLATDSETGYSVERFERLKDDWNKPDFGVTCRFGNTTTKIEEDEELELCGSPSKPCSSLRCRTPNMNLNGIQPVPLDLSLNAEENEYSNPVQFTFNTPYVDQLQPSEGAASGGGIVQIHGNNFVNAPCANGDENLETQSCLQCRYETKMNGVAQVAKRVVATFISTKLVTCLLLPAQEMGYTSMMTGCGDDCFGTIVISVSSNGKEFTDVTPQTMYTYRMTLTFANFEPNAGSISGNTTVVVYGSGFGARHAIMCRFGNAHDSKTKFVDVRATYVSPSQIKCMSPPWNVENLVDGGVFLGFSANGHDFCELLRVDENDISLGFDCEFTHKNPAKQRPFFYHRGMEVLDIIPPAGDQSGGTEVHIRGKGFTGYGQQLDVYFGEGDYMISIKELKLPPVVLLNDTHVKFETPRFNSLTNLNLESEESYYILDKAYPIRISSNKQQFTEVQMGQNCPAVEGNIYANCREPFVMFTWYTNPTVSVVSKQVNNWYDSLSTPLYDILTNQDDVPQGPISGGTEVTLTGSDFTSLGRPRIDGGLGVYPAGCKGSYSTSPCYTTCNFPFIHAIQGSQFYDKCINLKRTSDQANYQPDQYWCVVGDSKTFANQYGLCNLDIAQWKDFRQGGKYVTNLECRFGQTHVPAVVIDNSTIKCVSPPHTYGTLVPLTVTLNRKDYSRVLSGTYFQYIKPAPKAIGARLDNAVASVVVKFDSATNLQGLTDAGRKMTAASAQQSGCRGLFAETFTDSMGADTYAICTWSADNTSLSINLGKRPTFGIGDTVVYNDEPCERQGNCWSTPKPNDLRISPFTTPPCFYPSLVGGCDQIYSQKKRWCGRCIPNSEPGSVSILKVPIMDLSYPFNHSDRSLKILAPVSVVKPSIIIAAPKIVDNCLSVCFGGQNDGKPCSQDSGYCGVNGKCEPLLVTLNAENSFGNAGRPFTLIEWGLDAAHTNDMDLARNLSMLNGKLIARVPASSKAAKLNPDQNKTLVYCFTLKLRNWLGGYGNTSSCYKVEQVGDDPQPSFHMRTTSSKNTKGQIDIALSEDLALTVSAAPSSCANTSADLTLSYSWGITPVPANWQVVITDASSLNIQARTVEWVADQEYTLTLTVTLSMPTGTSAASANYGLIYRNSKPVARIHGSDRTVGVMDDLVVDASSSYSPDKAEQERSRMDLIFCWSCKITENGGRASNSACPWGIPAEARGASMWTIDYQNLATSTKYHISVKVRPSTSNVTCQTLSQDDALVDEAAVEITTVDFQGRPANVSIFPLESYLVDRSRKFRLSGYVYSSQCFQGSLTAERCNVMYEWRFDPEVKGFKSTVSQGYGRVSVSLDQNVLVADSMQKYKIVLSARDMGGTNLEGRSEITVQVNTAPTNGECSITPAQGVALDTMFELECRRWQDEHLPLQFEFRAAVYADGNPVMMNLNSKQSDQSFATVLPAGDPLNNEILLIEAIVYDALGAAQIVSANPLPKVEFRLTGEKIDTMVEDAKARFNRHLKMGHNIAAAQQLSLFGSLLGNPAWGGFQAGKAKLKDTLSGLVNTYYNGGTARRRRLLALEQVTCNTECVTMLGQTHFFLTHSSPGELSRENCELGLKTFEKNLGGAVTLSSKTTSDLILQAIANCQQKITVEIWPVVQNVIDYIGVLVMKGKILSEKETFQGKIGQCGQAGGVVTCVEDNNFYVTFARISSTPSSVTKLAVRTGVQSDEFEIEISKDMKDPGGFDMYDVQMVLFGKGVNPHSSVVTTPLNSRMLRGSLRTANTQSNTLAKSISNYEAASKLPSNITLSIDSFEKVSKANTVNKTSGVFKGNVCGRWNATARAWEQFSEEFKSEDATLICETYFMSTEFAIITGKVGCDGKASTTPAENNACLKCNGGATAPRQGICDHEGIPCTLKSCAHLANSPKACPPEIPDCCLDQCYVCGGTNKRFIGLSSVNATGFCDFQGDVCPEGTLPSKCGVCKELRYRQSTRQNEGICDCSEGGTPNGGKVLDRCGVCDGGNKTMDYCGHNPAIPQRLVCHSMGEESPTWNKSCTGCDGIVRADLPWTFADKRKDGKQCKEVNSAWGKGGVVCDQCDVCGGDGSQCVGCDGVEKSGKQLDVCKICGGDGSKCKGCDGVSSETPTQLDACGKCGGNVFTFCSNTVPRYWCNSTTYKPTFEDSNGVLKELTKDVNEAAFKEYAEICKRGCGETPGSKYNKCGKCGLSDDECPPPCCSDDGTDDVPGCSKNKTSSCWGRDRWSLETGCKFGVYRDACGKCGGDGSLCRDCSGLSFGGKVPDPCGQCGGDGKQCVGCDNVINSGKVLDRCGVCDGKDSNLDICGDCIFPPAKPDQSCSGCDGKPHSGKAKDACGVCGGFNECKWRDGGSNVNAEFMDVPLSV